MEMLAVDMRVMMGVNRHRSAFLDAFFSTVTRTRAGSLFVLLPLTAVLTGYPLVCQKKEAIYISGMGFGGVILFTYFLKAVIKRPRPDMFEPLIAMPADFSFPSAHTAQISAFCLCLLLIVGKDRLYWTGLLTLASVMLS
jgi:undecaprenyl-diphosphatase